MLFTPTKIPGAFLIDIERRVDQRGYFARAFCQREYEAAGLNPRIAQVNWSSNSLKGTLRGVHFQIPPSQEAKVVCCTRGALYDVVLDLRQDSDSYRTWIAAELTSENRRMFYIPEGCAHGFQTLADETEVLYLMSEFYSQGHACGIRYDDPAFDIEWPLEVMCISNADKSWPRYEKA
jgi:dTDP-4-dehydrorhamnose 3,5-epimerase